MSGTRHLLSRRLSRYSLRMNNFANVSRDLMRPKERRTIFDLAPRERMKMMVTVQKERKRSGKSTKSNTSTFSNASTWVALEQKPDICVEFYCTLTIIMAIVFFLLPKTIHLYLLPWLLTPALYNTLF